MSRNIGDTATQKEKTDVSCVNKTCHTCVTPNQVAKSGAMMQDDFGLTLLSDQNTPLSSPGSQGMEGHNDIVGSKDSAAQKQQP